MSAVGDSKIEDGGSAIADPTTILRKFQYTSLEGNSNKWYVYEITPRAGALAVIGKFGRVGDKGQTHDYGVISQRELDRIVSERRKKGYVEVELHAVEVTPGASGSSGSSGIDMSSAEGRLSYLIYREAGEAIATYLSTTVDALSTTQLERGRILLSAINATRAMGYSKDLNDQMLLGSVEAYYRTIPTILPRRIKPVELVESFDVTEQENRLNQLDAALATYKAVAGGQTQQLALGCTIRFVDGEAAGSTVRDYIERTRKGQHIRVLEVFEIEIPPERAAFKAGPAVSDQNRKLLFHGTKNPNVRHILKGGLRIMGSAANGRALGNGLYFADQSAKSMNYTGSAGRAGKAPEMMFLSEVALGRMYTISRSYAGSGAPAGYDSVYSPGGGGTWAYNEYCIYRADRCTARYLVTFER